MSVYRHFGYQFHGFQIDNIPLRSSHASVFLKSTLEVQSICNSMTHWSCQAPMVLVPFKKKKKNGIFFNSGDTPIRHLGILIGHNPGLCATAMFTRIKTSLARAVAHWSARKLSFLGRVHVAKQALASRLWYFATFVSPPDALRKDISNIIYAYIAGSPSPQATPHLYPNREVSSLPYDTGGVRLVDIRIQISALQAKLIARILETLGRHCSSNGFKGL